MNILKIPNLPMAPGSPLAYCWLSLIQMFLFKEEREYFLRLICELPGNGAV